MKKVSVLGAALGVAAAVLVAFSGGAIAQSVGSVISLRSTNFPTHHVRHRNALGEMSPLTSPLDRADASFRVVAGLAGRGISFESVNFPGHFLRHQDYRVKLARNDNSDLFRQDATFVPRAALSNTAGSFSYEAANAPGHYIRHCNSHVYLDNNTRNNRDCATNTFQADVSFTPVPAAP